MSVGHIARLVEAAGIPTVIVASAVFRDRLAAMHLPRVLVTHHPLGRPLGAPGDTSTQRRVLLAALDLLENAPHSGSLLDLSSRYRPGATCES